MGIDRDSHDEIMPLIPENGANDGITYDEKYVIKSDTLRAIADAISEKAGDTHSGARGELYTPAKMVEKINNLEVANLYGSLDITGNIDYGFTKISTRLLNFYQPLRQYLNIYNIASARYCFYNNPVENLDWITLNFEPYPRTAPYTSNYHSIGYMFYGCSNLLFLPTLNNVRPMDTNQLFYNCSKLKYIPDNFVNDTWDDGISKNYSSSNHSKMFYSCYSLRKIPNNLLQMCRGNNTSASNVYTNTGFQNCYSLEELVDIPIPTTGIISSGGSIFSNCISNCFRLKRFTFETNPDGTPVVATFKGASLSFTSYVGYTGTANNSNTANPYLPNSSKKITDANSQLQYGEDEDAWTQDIKYSRYNYISAVETINSLPDTSAYGTNTISFKKTAGSGTDGGAIQNLTPEQIAVATAKGWTVSLVS